MHFDADKFNIIILALVESLQIISRVIECRDKGGKGLPH